MYIFEGRRHGYLNASSSSPFSSSAAVRLLDSPSMLAAILAAFSAVSLKRLILI